MKDGKKQEKRKTGFERWLETKERVSKMVRRKIGKRWCVKDGEKQRIRRGKTR